MHRLAYRSMLDGMTNAKITPKPTPKLDGPYVSLTATPEASKPVLAIDPLPVASAPPMALHSAQEQERILVDEYCATLSIRKAAQAARMSPAAAQAALDRPEIKAMAIAQLDARSIRTHVSAERVINELAAIAFGKPSDNLLYGNISELTADERQMIAGFKMGKFGPEVKLHNKIEALALLGKSLKLFTDVVQNNVVYQQMGQIVIDGKPLEFDVGEPVSQLCDKANATDV